MSKPKIPLHETKPIKNIVEAASHLLMPDLRGLSLLFIEMKASINEERAACLRKKEQIKSEGFAAAMRLMLLDQDIKEITRPYFDKLKNYGD